MVSGMQKTKFGQSDKWIEIRTEFDGKMVNLYIIDSGIGIDEEIAEKIMTPFFTTKDIGKGTGLGLSISKGIIEAHHGSFELVSSSENTMFKISLPR